MVSVSASKVFVGRGQELAALLAAAQSPQVRTVFVAGEAGIGKSRLVAEFVARQGTETLVLVGRCPEFGSAGVPFAPFLAIMRALLRAHGVAALAELLPPRPALARWIPELATESAGDSDRMRLFGELLTVLERLERSVLLVVEDLHWADDSSRELLAFLTANLAEPQVLIAGTYRPSGSAALRTLIAELRRNPAVRVITPEPLSKHEVGRQLAALFGREPEPSLIARVYERSAGNPLFVEALSRSPDDTPAELSDLLLAAQADLDDTPREVLQLAAVAGSPVDHDLLASAAELPAAHLRKALRQLTDHYLLLPTDTGYEFRHALIREAVYQDLLPVERKRLHARLTQLLRDHPALLPAERRNAELARHAHAAQDHATARASALAAAMDAARAGAHPERLHHLTMALDNWAESAAGPVLDVDSVLAEWYSPTSDSRAHLERLVVLEHIVDACCHTGAVTHGIATADAALAQVDPATDPLRAARLHRHRAHLHNHGGTGGRDDLERALDLVPPDPPTLLRGEILTELSVTHAFANEAAAAQSTARAALTIAEQLPDAAHSPDPEISGLAARAHAYLGLTEDDSTTAKQHFDRARRAAEAAQDGPILVSVATWESAVQVGLGEYEAAIETVRHGLRIAHETFQFSERGPILVVKWAQALTALGRWTQAAELIAETLSDPLPPLATAALHLCRARIMVARGEFDSAAGAAEAAAERLGASGWVGPYRLELGGVQAAVSRADPLRAARILADALGSDDALRYPSDTWPLLALGTRIPERAIDFERLAKELPCTTPVDAAHRAVFTATTEPTPAAWRIAVQSWQAVPNPLEQAHALYDCARAELAAGDRAAAHTALRSAADIADRLGAKPLAEAIGTAALRARLTLQETASARATAPRTFGLTTRELEVLRLVAQGLSNRQLAAELFISANTAGVHVSRILTKLSAATRTEAAALAHRHGLLESSGA
ncbi:AAA family ATPase [Nocardia sp. NPDC050712]|uniref:helix-turn-helix transcriptional regulator n=1 Tax=Nocardia sp. NPDC050712 TaxID=3155518 RepID=UPI003405BDB1